MQRLGSLSYMVKVQDLMRHVHIDHLIVGTNSDPDIESGTNPEDDIVPVVPNNANARPPPQVNAGANAPVQAEQRRRNPKRRCGAPKRLDL